MGICRYISHSLFPRALACSFSPPVRHFSSFFFYFFFFSFTCVFVFFYFALPLFLLLSSFVSGWKGRRAKQAMSALCCCCRCWWYRCRWWCLCHAVQNGSLSQKMRKKGERKNKDKEKKIKFAAVCWYFSLDTAGAVYRSCALCLLPFRPSLFLPFSPPLFTKCELALTLDALAKLPA